MRQQSLEPVRESRGIEDFILASPDDHCGQLRLGELLFKHVNLASARALSSRGIQRGQARVSSRLSASGSAAS
jgi:hypothetical protein